MVIIVTCYGIGIPAVMEVVFLYKGVISVSLAAAVSVVNSAYDGGGVSARGSSNVNISGNTTFSGNSASGPSGGGGVSA